MNKILLVEDDSTLAMGLEYSLEDEGMDVKIVDNIKDAYTTFKNDNFHLILLDVTLPDGTGYELCKRIRAESQVPIIFLTACDDEVNVVLGLDIGGDDYVTKPFRVKELISRINAVIRRNRLKESNNRNTLINLEKIKIDLLANKVYKDGEEIFLTPIEFKLISILASNPNRVMSRNQILEKIWDYSGDYIDDNTLSVHIRRLREKIEDDAAAPNYIMTVRGIGYKFNVYVLHKEVKK